MKPRRTLKSDLTRLASWISGLLFVGAWFMAVCFASWLAGGDPGL